MEKIQFNADNLSAVLKSTKVDFKQVAKKYNVKTYSVSTTQKGKMFVSFYDKDDKFIAQYSSNGVETTETAKKFMAQKAIEYNKKIEKKFDEDARKKRTESERIKKELFAPHEAVLELKKQGRITDAAIVSMKPKKLQSAISDMLDQETRLKFMEIPFSEIIAYIKSK